MGRALLFLLIGAAITVGVLYPRHVQQAVETIVPPDEPAAPPKPRQLVSPTQLQDCIDACDLRGTLEHLADATVRACRSGCQARVARLSHETPTRITVAPASRP